MPPILDLVACIIVFGSIYPQYFQLVRKACLWSPSNKYELYPKYCRTLREYANLAKLPKADSKAGAKLISQDDVLPQSSAPGEVSANHT